MRGGVIALATSERRSGARRCLAIVGLLLVCTLMAGAVSAAGTEFNQSSFSGDTYTINSSGTYVLNDTAVGNVSVDVSSGDVVITANSGVTLHGYIKITDAQSVTVHDMNIHLNKSMVTSDSRLDAVVLGSTNSAKINLTRNAVTFASDIQGQTQIKSNLFSSGVALSDGSVFSQNTITNVTGHLLRVNGAAVGATVNVTGNHVSMMPDEVYGGADGRALLKVWMGDVTSPVTFNVRDNVITNNNKSREVAVVRFDDSSNAGDDINVTIINNSIDGNSASPYLYNGTVTSFKSLKIANADGSLILVPGLNQTGVTWGDATSGRTLAISTAGSYKLMNNFITTGNGINITANDVTFDGNHKLINASIPVVTKNENYPVVSVTGMNVSLQNLNIVARTTDGSMNVNYLNAVTVSPKENSAGSFNLSNSILNMSGTSNLGQTIVVHVTGSTAAYSTVTLTNNTLYGAKSTNNADTVTGQNNGTSFGIAVEGVNISDKLTITKNTIYTGMAGNSGSVGMRTYHLTGAPKNGILIDGNLIDFEHAAGHYLSGIHMDQVNKKHAFSLNYTITNNTIKNLKAGNETDAENSNKNAGIYLRKVNATTSTTIQLEMHNNIISGKLDNESKNVTAFYANNVTFGASTIYNNTFNITGADVLKYVRLFDCDATQDQIKWNSTGSDKAHAGNWWGTWSEGKKSTTGYLTFADATAAKAAGLPVADLAPLVTIGQPASTIEVTGNFSIENKTGNSGTLVAQFTGGVAANFTWTTTQTGIITLSPTSGSSVTYTQKNVGTTTVTVSSGTVTKNITITVYDEVKAPALPVSGVTKDETTGNTTISNTSEVAISNNIATIKDTTNGVTMVVIFGEAPTVDSHQGSIAGNVSSANVTYPEKIAALSPDVANGATEITTRYGLVINLKNVTNQLPTIDPVFNTSIIEAIKAKNEDAKFGKYTFISMITATENVTEINNNVTSGGVAVTFIIPLDWAKQITGDQLGKLKAFHLKSDRTVTPLTGTGIANATKNTYTFTVKGNSFSSYVLGAYTYIAPTPVPTSGSSSGSGNTDGALRVLFVTDGGSSGSIVAGLSSGDKVKQPATPVRNGYTFGGWYTDAACTKPWSFSSSINGDMTLYAKWTSNGSGTVETYPATANPTQPATATQTSSGGANPTGTAAATTAQSGGVSPTMTKAPAPVFGLLAGLLAAGVLLRRRA